jgi:hypothetical protein
MKFIHPRTAIEMNWIPAFAGMTDEEKINRGFRVSKEPAHGS